MTVTMTMTMQEKQGTMPLLKNFFFQEQNFFFQGTTFVQFFMYCKAKKNFRVIRKFLKIFDFQKS